MDKKAPHAESELPPRKPSVYMTEPISSKRYKELMKSPGETRVSALQAFAREHQIVAASAA